MTSGPHDSEPSGQALPSGTRIEEFVIEQVLGSGGFGITYLARDARLGRQVVIKENLPAQFCFRDTHSLTVAPRHTHGDDVDNFRWSLENFSKEAAMLASLDHPGIVRVLRSFQAFGTAYFVMPFVEGIPLDELLKERQEAGQVFSEDELHGMLERILDALAYLHARGIYHRDIKPGNILITNDGIPVLIDFGSARQRLSERSMTVVESAGYTPFEQLQTRGNVGPWSDLYALGATLVKVMTGEAPPKTNDRSFGDPWLPLAGRAEMNKWFSAGFLACVDRSLRLPVEERWQNAGEWQIALRGNATLATPPPKPERTERTKRPSVISIIPKRKINHVPWAIAACVALMGLFVLAKQFSNKEPGSRPVTVVDDSAVQRERDKAEAATAQTQDAEQRAVLAEQEKQALAARAKVEVGEKQAAEKEAERRKADAIRLEKDEAAAKEQRESKLLEGEADFSEVGRQMAIMLQNSHFVRLPFNAELSRRFLEDYLNDLDSQRLYFTQQDVDKFMTDYGGCLHTLLLEGKFMPGATEIYRVFEKRVEERVAQAEELLFGTEFDFTADEKTLLSRKNAAWPKNDKEAADLWRLQIKEAVLAELLRQEALAKHAKLKGETTLGSDNRTPRELVSLRYRRFLVGVRSVDTEEIANYFLSAVASAYDPHSDYMSFREMNRYKDGINNELVGIGALLQAEEDGATKIMGIVIGGPADQEGSLKLNDRVMAVDTLNTRKPEDMMDIMFMKIDKVVNLIRCKEGTSVALKVEPTGGAPGVARIVVIQRGKVALKDEHASVEVFEMKNLKGELQRLGVITLPSFYADFEDGKVSCAKDVEKILKRLTDIKIDGLILDLRNNGGGALEEVRRMTGFFIERGPIVQVKNTLGQVQVKDSENSKPLYSGPMVIMTNKSSAGASEILSGALQDYNRAVVVGESSTFGYGTVQQPMDIARMLPKFKIRSRAGFLKVTIQKFYRPSGVSTQMDGVKSDVFVPILTDALETGEAFLDHPLPHDRIPRTPDFKPLDPQALFIPRLKELSQKRLNASKDFSYVIQDIMKTKERLKANTLSLNKAAREKELAEFDAQQKERNIELRARFEIMTNEDRKKLKFFKLTLEDIDKGVDLKTYDPSDENGEYMHRAKDLDGTPKWPSGLDPIKRESIMVLRDLADILSKK